MSKFQVTSATQDYVDQLEWNDKLAVATSVEQIRFHSKFKVHCFRNPQSIYEYPLSFFVQKDFPFLIELNMFIQQTGSSGLLSKWLGNYQNEFSIKSDNFRYIEMNIDTIWYMGSVCLCMLLTAFLVLNVERFIHKRTREMDVLRVWRFVEIMIDPKRHFLLKDLSL